MIAPLIALVGDYRPEVIAHRCIPDALRLASGPEGTIGFRWIATTELSTAPSQLEAFSAVWLVPASPYADMDAALSAVQFARTTDRPFLGTCGGFQHALIEFARNVAGLASADHAETSPAAVTPVVTALKCNLVDQSQTLRLVPGSQLQKCYGADTATEGYRCNYGVNSAYRPHLETAGLRFTAFDHANEVRAFELPAQRFFIGTLFQPERSALTGSPHPLIRAFVQATLSAARS
jgi:CTP synthase (UTP-ammonia lyase)